MKYEKIRIDACEGNKLLSKTGLVWQTFGNLGVFDKSEGVFAIKPSGVDYASLTSETMVVLDLDCKVVDGNLRPSSDSPTYAVLFKNFGVASIVHTHSKCAVSFAQAGLEIDAYGTTHADYFFGAIPITRKMSPSEIAENYEAQTGNVIVERFKTGNINPTEIPAVLVRSHGPFAWGESATKAVNNAVSLELCAEMAMNSMLLNPKILPMQDALLKKHFLRKHGKNAYYGQQNR